MTSIQISAQAKIQWQARQSTTSSRWIGECQPMNLVMEAEDLNELYSLIDEAMQLMLMDLLRDNELDQFLREHGWRAHGIPAQLGPEEVEFSVPWEVIAEGARRDSEHRTH